MSDRLQVGVSVLRAAAHGFSHRQAVEQLVDGALRSLNTDQAPISCLLLLTTADWCRLPSSLPKGIRRRVEKRVGCQIPLIGGSMARLYCSTEPNPYIEQGAILIAFCSYDFRVSVAGLATPYALTDQERKAELARLATGLELFASMRPSAGAERYLMGFLPGIFADKHGNQEYRDNELHQEILSAFDFRYPLVGGAAADGLVPMTGYQFANDDCLESGLALALIESDLAMGMMMEHGFVPRLRPRISVDALAGPGSNGYNVQTLDGKPALKCVEELVRDGRNQQGGPVFGLPCGDDTHIILPMKVQKGRDGSLRLSRKVALGDRLYVLDATPGQMTVAGQKAMKGACEAAGATLADLSFVLTFSCTGRFHKYQDGQIAWADSIEQVRKDYTGVPAVVALCAGEFGLDASRRWRANNLSSSMWCITNTHAGRCKIRELQDNLIKAAERVSSCMTPTEVMQVALESAVESGATGGGQICTVEGKIERILGEGFGYALQPNGSSHNWPAVARLTNRGASLNVGGSFPSCLREWAIPVVEKIPLNIVLSPEKEEDILTFVARTLHAVFVPDTQDRRFLCNRKAAAAGRIRTMLAIPLVGYQRRAIATLQLSFADGTLLDRETFAAWVSYAQKVAAALERTQEAEEKRMLKELSDFGNKIMQTPSNPKAGLHDWCDNYLETVVRLLGADGGHMRLLQSRPSGEQYSLIGSVGLLGRLRRLTRPVTHPGEGSCSLKLLAGGGHITYTREQTAELNKNVGATDNEDVHGRAFSRELKKLESTAMLPLYHEDHILGSFVIDSKKRYFMTERRERVTRAAAELAGSILRSKKTEYDRDELSKKQEWVLGMLTGATEGGAEQRLRGLIERLATEIRADVASVYIWHDAPERMILHVAHNWVHLPDRPPSYARGEGWTGSLANAAHVVTIVKASSAKPSECTRKYYEYMVPRDRQAPKDASDPRIGVRLGDGKRFVGVVTFTYCEGNAEYLTNEEAWISKLLKALAPLLTLGVEAFRQDIFRKQIAALIKAEKDAAATALQAARPDGNLKEVVDMIRDRFQVERVTFYDYRNGRLSHGFTSRDSTHEFESEPSQAVEPLGPMRNIIARKEGLSIGDSKSHLLAHWPNRKTVKALFAAPVLLANGDVRGVLEFANRKVTEDHPFELLDNYEQSAALDVTRALGATIDHREDELKRSELTTKLMTATKIGAAGLLSAVLLHELLSPFAHIQHCIDLLRLVDASKEEQDLYFRRIENHCAHAQRIVSAAVEHGLPGVRMESLRAVVREALRAVEPEIPLTGVALVVQNDVTVLVNVDLWVIVGALVNLLSNALEAIGGVGTLTVTTGVSSDGRNALVHIHNTGSSLTEQDIAMIFQPGYTTKSARGHLGFGLSLVQQAISSASGRIQMRSPSQGGVEVVVSLPVTPGESRNTRAEGGPNA